MSDLKDIRGLFIRLERNKLGYSLEALSHGICSPSHLSKIENNETKGSDEVYSLLFEKMGTDLICNEEVDNITEKIDSFFDAFFNLDFNCKNICLSLLKDEKKVLNSSAYLYFQIFKLYALDLGCTNNNEGAVELEMYSQFMNEK